MYICLGSISISPTGVTVSLRVLVPWDWIGMNWIGSGFGSSGGIGGSGSTAGSVAFVCCHYNSPMYVWHVSRAMYVRMYVRWYASFRASFLLGFAPCHPNHPTTASTPFPHRRLYTVPGAENRKAFCSSPRKRECDCDHDSDWIRFESSRFKYITQSQ